MRAPPIPSTPILASTAVAPAKTAESRDQTSQFKSGGLIPSKKRVNHAMSTEHIDRLDADQTSQEPKNLGE